MGVKLIEEFKHTPTPGLNAADRLVMFLLAESGRDATRVAMPGQEAMLRASGMSDTALKRSLGKLCDAGLIERIPVGVGRNGKPLYACPGRRAEFRIVQQPPGAAATDEDPRPATNGRHGRSTTADMGSARGPHMGSAGGPLIDRNGAHLEQEWGPYEADLGPTGGPPSVITRQGTSVNACARGESNGRLLRLVARKIEEMTGRPTSEEHAGRVVRHLVEGRSVRDPEKYVLGSIENDRDPSRFAETPQPPRYVPPPERTA